MEALGSRAAADDREIIQDPAAVFVRRPEWAAAEVLVPVVRVVAVADHKI